MKTETTVNTCCTSEGCCYTESFFLRHTRLIPRLLDYGRDFQLPVKPQTQSVGQLLPESSCVSSNADVLSCEVEKKGQVASK